MKKIISICFFTFLGCIPAVYAQRFLEKVAQKAVQKVEQKAEQKLDEKLDAALDRAMERTDSALQSMGAFNDQLQGIEMTKEPVAVPDRYFFSQSIAVQMTITSGKGEPQPPVDMTFFIDPHGEAVGYESKNQQSKSFGFIIVDAAIPAMLMLGEENGKKSGMVTGLKIKQKSVPQTDSLASVTWHKTGRSKALLGHQCEEYVSGSEGVHSEYWVTSQLSEYGKGWMASMENKQLKDRGYPHGMVLESISTQKNGEKVHMLVTQLNAEVKQLIQVSDYELIQLGTLKL